MTRHLDVLARRYPARRALITGATSGLGEALAVALGRGGWRVAVTGRNPDRVAASAEKVRAAGGTPLPLRIEAARHEDFVAAAAAVRQAWGGLDVLVNNAGVAPVGSIYAMALEDWRRAIDVNLWGVIHGTMAFAPMLRDGGGGLIVNVASGAGLLCGPQMANYNVSKAGVVALTETLAVECAGDGIRHLVVCPGVFASGIWHSEKSRTAAGDESAIVRSFQDALARTPDTAESTAETVLRDMARGRLYSFPQRSIWWFHLAKRLMPVTHRRLVGWMARRRLWLFAGYEP